MARALALARASGGRLASLVSEQEEMVARIDANTEDVEQNVRQASRVLQRTLDGFSNRTLAAKARVNGSTNEGTVNEC